MDKILQKKINLLIHLAKVDGKFDQAEKSLLKELMSAYGLDENYLKSEDSEVLDLDSLQSVPNKIELFYWVMKMIMADGYMHAEEEAFGKSLCIKMNIKPEAVEYFSTHETSSLESFEEKMKDFQL